MNNEELTNKMQQIVAKAWIDPAFKHKLLSDPVAAFEEEGVGIIDGFEVRVVENTDKMSYLVLPPKPSSDELSDEALAEVAGGLCVGSLLRSVRDNVLGPSFEFLNNNTNPFRLFGPCALGKCP